MKLPRFTIRIILASSFVLVAVTCAQAQVNRTFVSGVGDDTFPCSRTSPCKTFVGAMTKTNPGGEVDALDSGGFGTMIISKSITIDGGSMFASSLATGGVTAIRINAGDSDVVILRHLSITSGPDPAPGNSGIKVDKVGKLHVIDCLIKNFAHHGIDFEPSSTGAQLFVTASTIINNGSGSIDAGIFVKSTAVISATIDHCTVNGNQDGIVAKDRTRVSVSNSLISGNRVFGVIAASDSTARVEIDIESTVITRNQIGIRSGNCVASGPGVVRISNVSVTSNDAYGLMPTVSGPGCSGSGEIISAKNNTILGNRPDGSPTASPGQQ